MKKIFAVLGGAAILAGCGQMPQTAQGFREQIPGAFTA